MTHAFFFHMYSESSQQNNGAVWLSQDMARSPSKTMSMHNFDYDRGQVALDCSDPFSCTHVYRCWGNGMRIRRQIENFLRSYSLKP